MLKMRAPQGCTSASFEGETYLVKDGLITVPDNALLALSSHGFVHAPEVAAEVQTTENKSVLLPKKR